jgi:tetratricopeptide (TPR) repeat protein
LLDGRAALETLERDQIVRAREVFARVVSLTPDSAPPHIGLANACVLQFEMTRADATPDTEALRLAAHHAYEACRLDTENAEGWSSLSFILERIGKHGDAIAAARRAIALEPDNWRHQFRLASIAWGEERLRAARRTLTLLPGFALAHWLAATVLVARRMLDDAARELDAGIAGDRARAAEARFSSVALHWLRGLIQLAKGDQPRALQEFELELASEARGHLYARECCANTWYAIGAMHLSRGRQAEARKAFERALERVPRHRLARFGRDVADGVQPGHEPEAATRSIDEVLCAAAVQVMAGSPEAAASLVDQALQAAAPSNAAWLLPVEPLLNVGSAPAAWETALARLSARAM